MRWPPSIGPLASTSPGAPRYVLLCDPDITAARTLLATALLDPSPQLAAFWQHANFDRLMLRDLIAT